MELSYQEVIRGCRAGKQGAQLLFYDRFSAALFASAYRLLGNEWEAEEVVQEVLLRVLTDHSLLKDSPETMAALMRRMVINLSIDHLRQRKMVWEEWDDRLVLETQESIDLEIIRQEDIAQLYAAIAMLPDKDRTILMLTVVEELSTEEISQMLGIKPVSVRSQMCRAKQKLIKLMQR